MQYIFITFGIGGIGGGQIYLYRKGKYLESLGYKVSYVYYLQEEIIINQFSRFSIIRQPEISRPSYYYSIGFQNWIINRLIDKCRVKEGEPVIIESSNLCFATWGELLAERLRGKHIIYLIAEQNSIADDNQFEFLKYKSRNNELTGIRGSVSDLFTLSGYEINDLPIIKLRANCVSEVEDYKSDRLSNIPFEGSVCISIIGRLEKPYLIPTLLKLRSYCLEQDRRKNQYSIILVGDTSDVIIKNKIKEIFIGVENITVYITGYLYPVPKLLIDSTDVFIATSGSARLSADQGKYTIALDVRDGLPIGLLGYTTNETMSRGEEEPVDLTQLLDDILVTRIYKPRECLEKSAEDYSYDEHLRVCTDFKSDHYFTFSTLGLFNKRRIETLIFQFKRIVNRAVGDSFYKKMASIVR